MAESAATKVRFQDVTSLVLHESHSQTNRQKLHLKPEHGSSFDLHLMVYLHCT